jgi:hypothetical protein
MKSTNKPRFLLVQYAPGSAGRFLISLLMGSKDVAHYDPVIDHNKTIAGCTSYIEKHFIRQIGDWLKHEPSPHNTWNLHFISTKYSRGNDMSYDQFMLQAKQEASSYFWKQVVEQKIIVTPWHNTVIPDFYKDSKIVTILIDKNSEKWFHRAVWAKLYGIKDGRIHLKMHDPDFNPPMQQYFKKFNNPIYNDERFFKFAKEKILKDTFKTEYMDQNNFMPNINQAFINLSDLLSVDSCVANVNRVCQELKIDQIPEEIIRNGQMHWASCHLFKYNNI